MKYLIIILIILLPTNITQNNDQVLLDKIGQMIILGFRGTEISDDLIKNLEEIKPGGVILFDYDVPSGNRVRNIEDLDQVKKLITNLQENSETPLFIAIDLEGGRVNRLKKFFDFPSAQELGQENNLLKTKETSEKIAQELKKLGFNLNFAPVVDLNVNINNPIIGLLGRSFSGDSNRVFLHAQAFIEGQKKYNIIPVIKHFPGHGSSLHDSHLGMVDITKTYLTEELTPYKKIINNGFNGMVMTGHLINKNIDSNFPATLSNIFISQILREEIGFSGLVISDDMQMQAIIDNYEIEQAIILAINSGVDVLIFSNNNQEYDKLIGYKARDIIFRAVKKGIISEERINESYKKILEIKKEFNID